MTVNVPPLIAVPAGTVTRMRPLVAPIGTVVTILVAVSDVIVDGVPSKVMAVAPERFWPLIVTVVPTVPEEGVNFVMLGVAAVLIRPIELLPALVNHNAPSGPAVIPTGRRCRYRCSW